MKKLAQSDPEEIARRRRLIIECEVRHHISEQNKDGLKRATPKEIDFPIGWAIPNSRFIRDYCWGCGSPIRVADTNEQRLRRPYCTTCIPTGHSYDSHLTQRQKMGSGKIAFEAFEES